MPEKRIRLPQPTRIEASEGGDGLREAAALAADIDLADQQKLNKFNALTRENNTNRHLYIVTIAGIYTVAAACFVMFSVLVAQYVLPPKARFLPAADTAQLQSFLFSGIIGGVLTRVGGKVARLSGRR